MFPLNEFVLVFGVFLCTVGIIVIVFAYKKRITIIRTSIADAETIFDKNRKRANKLIVLALKKQQDIVKDAEKSVIPIQERVDKLKAADEELTSRLEQSTKILEHIAERSCAHVADIELLTLGDLLSSKTYKEERKDIKAKLKKLAVNAIDGLNNNNSNEDITKFVSISAKADLAGALLLTTAEMLCAKVNANSEHKALEKLSESIIATEALIKCIDSRAEIYEEFKNLLIKRLEIEIHFKKAKQLPKEKQKELQEQERQERQERQEIH